MFLFFFVVPYISNNKEDKLPNSNHRSSGKIESFTLRYVLATARLLLYVASTRRVLYRNVSNKSKRSVDNNLSDPIIFIAFAAVFEEQSSARGSDIAFSFLFFLLLFERRASIIPVGRL